MKTPTWEVLAHLGLYERDYPHLFIIGSAYDRACDRARECRDSTSLRIADTIDATHTRADVRNGIGRMVEAMAQADALQEVFAACVARALVKEGRIPNDGPGQLLMAGASAIHEVMTRPLKKEG
jgi:hypothetical protein